MHWLCHMSAVYERFWVVDENGQTLFGHDPTTRLHPEWCALAGRLLGSAHPGPLSLAVPGAELTAWRLMATDTALGSPAAVVLRVRPLARMVGSAPQRHAAPVPDLTPRQLEVCEYAASGATVDEIAAHLHISPGTVRTHLKTVYRNLGVANRVELARALGAFEPRVAAAAE
jgi:DNA-binding CsgD family transcriptional regulator